MTGPPSPECHKNKIILRLTVVPDFHHEPEGSFTASGGDKGDKGTYWALAQPLWALAAKPSLLLHRRSSIKSTAFV